MTAKTATTETGVEGLILGRLEGQVGLLIQAVDKLDKDAEDARAIVRQDISDIKSRLIGVERELREMGPIVKRFETGRMQALGFILGLGVAGGALGAKLAEAARGFLGGQ